MLSSKQTTIGIALMLALAVLLACGGGFPQDR